MADVEDGARESEGTPDDGDDAHSIGGASKKRSRTLTTAHQTAVLNSLLATVSRIASHLLSKDRLELTFTTPRDSTDEVSVNGNARGNWATNWNVFEESADLVPECKSPFLAYAQSRF